MIYLYIAILILSISCKDSSNQNGGVSNNGEILGCTDIAATNYNSNATENDGSCEYSGEYGVCSQNVQVCLSLNPNDNNSASALVYISSVDIAGIQFNHNGCVTSAQGGDASENGFSITSSSSAVIGFSMMGDAIPSGSGTLISLTGQITEECLYNFVFSDSNGGSLTSGWSD